MKATVNGFSINYEIHGTGNWLTLIHGSSNNLDVWHNQVAAFSQHYSVLTYDIRGHGLSELPNEGLTAEVFTADLYLLLQALNINSTILIGHSMGGEIALRFALSYPQITRALIVSNSVMGLYAGTKDIQEVRQRRNEQETDRENSTQDINEKISRFFSPGVMKRKPEVIEYYKTMAVRNKNQRSTDERARQGEMIGMLMYAPMRHLSGIKCPTMMITGEHDHLVGPHMAHAIKKALPSAEIQILASGHYPFLELPEQFNETVLRFLEKSL